MVIEYTLKINGIEVKNTDEHCPDTQTSYPTDYDPTACPIGYLCKLNPAKGMRTKRIEAERKYKASIKFPKK